MQRMFFGLLAMLGSAVASQADVILVTSTDVPKVIVDNNPVGFTTTLTGPNLLNLTDVNLIFNDLRHTSVPDLHIELRSPSGTQVVLYKAFAEGGILTGFGTPDNFINTVFDDQAATNLQAGASPFTGSFNINHPSVVANPLSVFNGENAAGTWTLFVSDRAAVDSGVLNSWSLQFTGSPIPEPATLAVFGGIALAGAFGYRRRKATVAA